MTLSRPFLLAASLLAFGCASVPPSPPSPELATQGRFRAPEQSCSTLCSSDADCTPQAGCVIGPGVTCSGSCLGGCCE